MDQSQKTPIARSLEQFANRKVRGALDLLGQQLPASVVVVVSSGIVTVKFELTNIPFTLPQITVPMIGSEYVRIPVQGGPNGTKGMVIAADAFLGGVSGLGGGTADLSPRPNLSNLAFVPLGNTAWSATDNPDAALIYGPDGVVIRTVAKDAVITVATGSITLKAPSIVFDGPVNFKNAVTGESGVIDFGPTKIQAGDITSNGKDVGSAHEHSGVLTGGANTGPPV